MIRLGIVGLGMAVAPHVAALRELQADGRVEVVGGWSRSEGRRAAFAAAFGLPVIDTVELLTERVDAILLLTPPNARDALVERFAASGKHVLMEKPLERTTAAAERLVAGCRAAGIRLGIVLQHRFRPTSLRLKALLAEGTLGEPTVVQLSVPWWRPQSYYDEPGRGTLARDGGGVLLSQAIHPLDLMLSLMGPVRTVAAVAGTSRMHRMETEDTVAAGLRFASGALGGVFATTSSYPGTPETLSITCTEGTATIAAGSLQVVWHDGRTERMAGEAQTGAGASPMAFSHEAHKAVLADFLDAVEQGRDPAISGESALEVHRLIDALLASSQEGLKARL